MAAWIAAATEAPGCALVGRVSVRLGAMEQTVLYLERSIDASHIIDGHPGKCGRLHGHTYRFQVWLWGEIPAGEAMLIDFYDVKAAIDAWDHRHLNDEVDFVPTAELLAAEMQRRLAGVLAERCGADSGVRVRLWETPGAYAQVGGPVPGQ